MRQTARRLRAAYLEEHLAECVKLVTEHGCTGAVARQTILDRHGVRIPKGTLSNYVNGRRSPNGTVTKSKLGARLGRPTLLTPEQEQELYNKIVRAMSLGCPVTPRMVKLDAWKLCTVDNVISHETGGKMNQSFGPDGPSDRWYESFARRWKLVGRITSDREPKRTSALNASVVNDTFDEYEKARSTGYNGCAFPSSRIWNMDEFGVQSRAEKQSAGVFISGWREPCQRTGAGDRQSYTGIACNSAAGEGVPLSFIMKGQWRDGPNQKEMHRLVQEWGGVIAWKSDTHLMNGEYFVAWLEWFAKKTGCSKADPVMLVLDGHGSRIRCSTWEMALGMGVKLFILPGAVTSHLQPQDVGVLGPFKRELNTTYRNFCVHMPNVPLVAAHHMRQLLVAWKKVVTPKVILDAWDKCGLATKDSTPVGMPNRDRLLPAIMRAEPYRNTKLESKTEDAEMIARAFERPLPCPKKNDLRRRYEVPDTPIITDDMSQVLKHLLLVRADVLKPPPEQASVRNAIDEVEAAKKKKKAKTKPGNKIRSKAIFADEAVRSANRICARDA
jgi:hypothetical protein